MITCPSILFSQTERSHHGVSVVYGPQACPLLIIARYTASFAFFEALWEYGVSHVFVNLGSDHPSIIEAIVKGQNEKKGQFPKIITCPNEASNLLAT